MLCLSQPASAQVSSPLPLTLPSEKVHMGVDKEATEYRLETYAANEASFRCPDQAGWQPSQESIDDSHPFASKLLTDLPVSVIAGSVAEGAVVESWSGWGVHCKERRQPELDLKLCNRLSAFRLYNPATFHEVPGSFTPHLGPPSPSPRSKSIDPSSPHRLQLLQVC